MSVELARLDAAMKTNIENYRAHCKLPSYEWNYINPGDERMMQATRCCRLFSSISSLLPGRICIAGSTEKRMKILFMNFHQNIFRVHFLHSTYLLNGSINMTFCLMLRKEKRRKFFLGIIFLIYLSNIFSDVC